MAGGSITVATYTQARSEAVVEVRDNGPGLAPKNGAADGVGLANTRSRLQRLYGDDHNFGMANAAEGGLVVTLEIPFHVKPSRQVATP